MSAAFSLKNSDKIYKRSRDEEQELFFTSEPNANKFNERSKLEQDDEKAFGFAYDFSNLPRIVAVHTLDREEEMTKERCTSVEIFQPEGFERNLNVSQSYLWPNTDRLQRSSFEYETSIPKERLVNESHDRESHDRGWHRRQRINKNADEFLEKRKYKLRRRESVMSLERQRLNRRVCSRYIRRSNEKDDNEGNNAFINKNVMFDQHENYIYSEEDQRPTKELAIKYVRSKNQSNAFHKDLERASKCKVLDKSLYGQEKNNFSSRYISLGSSINSISNKKDTVYYDKMFDSIECPPCKGLGNESEEI